MATSLKDIARLAGVSAGAVSDILNRGREHLYSAQTRQRVVECSLRLGYLPNRAAQAMRSQKTRVVGFVAPNLTPDGELFNYDVYPFIVGLGRELATKGYHVVTLDSTSIEDPAKQGQPWKLEDRFFDGLVIHHGLSDRGARFTSDMGVPLIWWDSGVFDPYGCIYRDERLVGQEVTSRLIAMGHSRIGYMVGERRWRSYCRGGPGHYSYAHRFESYRDEMIRNKLHPVPILGYEPHAVAKQLAEHRITALIIQVPYCLTLGQAVQHLNWRVPEDLTIVTLDRELRKPARERQLGGMSYDRVEAGQQAARMMLSALEEKAAAVPSVRIVGQFDPGCTVAPPRHP